MSSYTVTIRRLDSPPRYLFALGSTSAAVAEHAAGRHGACGITVTPFNKERKQHGSR